MRIYKCNFCAFAFSEADKDWDSAIDSGRCPKCSEPLSDFPVPIRSQRQGASDDLENEKTMAEQNSVAKVSEEEMYAAALAEIQSGTTRPGLWAKAFADSEGDENKSKALYIKLRVQQEIERIQQEQNAADALVAESVRRKAAAFQSVLDQLQLKGYEIKRTASGWAVREPLGGRVKFNSDKSLLEYAQRYGVQPLPPGEHPVAGGRTAVAPELRDSFSSKSAERTDEKSGTSTRRPYEMSKYVRIMYFLLVGFSVALLCMLISPVLGITAAENLAPAGVALWIGWSLNDKTRRLDLSKTSYFALCVVYLIAATTLRAILMPSHAINERGSYYFILLIAIAYVFPWLAIKTNKQKPMNV